MFQIIGGELEELLKLIGLDGLYHQYFISRFGELAVALASYCLPVLAVGQALHIRLVGDALGLSEQLELLVEVGSDLEALPTLAVIVHELSLDLIDLLLQLPTGGDIPR